MRKGMLVIGLIGSGMLCAGHLSPCRRVLKYSTLFSGQKPQNNVFNQARYAHSHDEQSKELAELKKKLGAQKKIGLGLSLFGGAANGALSATSFLVLHAPDLSSNTVMYSSGIASLLFLGYGCSIYGTNTIFKKDLYSFVKGIGDSYFIPSDKKTFAEGTAHIAKLIPLCLIAPNLLSIGACNNAVSDSLKKIISLEKEIEKLEQAQQGDTSSKETGDQKEKNSI